jgi:hypothetical protein
MVKYAHAIAPYGLRRTRCTMLKWLSCRSQGIEIVYLIFLLIWLFFRNLMHYALALALVFTVLLAVETRIAVRRDF